VTVGDTGCGKSADCTQIFQKRTSGPKGHIGSAPFTDGLKAHPYHSGVFSRSLNWPEPRNVRAKLFRRWKLAAPFCLLFGLAGCRARLIEANIVNHGAPLQLLEFDYPSASFGIDALPAGGVYHYSFAVQGPGPLTLHFEDSAGHTYTSTGPAVTKGQEGSLTVTIGSPRQVSWKPELTTAR
jgi:hypothetical protein